MTSSPVTLVLCCAIRIVAHIAMLVMPLSDNSTRILFRYNSERKKAMVIAGFTCRTCSALFYH